MHIPRWLRPSRLIRVFTHRKDREPWDVPFVPAFKWAEEDLWKNGIPLPLSRRQPQPELSRGPGDDELTVSWGVQSVCNICWRLIEGEPHMETTNLGGVNIRRRPFHKVCFKDWQERHPVYGYTASVEYFTGSVQDPTSYSNIEQEASQ